MSFQRPHATSCLNRFRAAHSHGARPTLRWRDRQRRRLAQSLGGLSRNHLHKIAQDLAALGIVKTIRGAGGGVKLAKAPRAVRIGALVRALESDQPLVECFRADHGCCTLDPGCRLRPMLKRARERFYETLDEYSLADCLAGPRNISMIL